MLNVRSLPKLSCPSRTNEYEFHLERISKDLFYPPVNVDFSPATQQNHEKLSVLPKYNRDGSYCTSAFVVPYDQMRQCGSLSAYTQQEKQKFLRKLDYAQTPVTVSKPFFDPKCQFYCSICHQQLSDYWKHVKSRVHLRNVRMCSANDYIHQLCQKFMGRRKGDRRKGKEQGRLGQSGPIAKTKQIKQTRKQTQVYQYCREDFIIKFPKQLLRKEVRVGSTEGQNGCTNTLK